MRMEPGSVGGGRQRPGRPRVLLTMGDPAGVGPEIALRTLADGGLRADFDLVAVGARDVFERCAARLWLPFDAQVVETAPEAAPSEPGRPTTAGAAAAAAAVVEAARLCLSGAADAMVTAPVIKATVAEAGYDFPGHTEFLARLAGAGCVVMTFVHGARRVGLVTNHLPLAAVAGALTKELVLEKLLTLARGLDAALGVKFPRIAVAALNPHAGERGAIGDEEARVIAPAVAAAREAGVDAEGPLPADALFPRLGAREGSGREGGARFDAALAMYHDQATIPLRLWGVGDAVNVTLGLPIVRTSPGHGVALDVAGRGVADAGGMIAATRLAGEIAARVARRRTGAG